MESRAKILGHPIHQMLIVFPLGLLGMGAIFDIIYLATGSARIADAAFWMLSAGIISGLVAAPFGLVDWLAIPSGTRAKMIGALHGGGNVVALLVFAASWWLRSDIPQAPATVAIAVNLVAFVMALGTGWLGGELVDRLAVGVDPGAHLDSPNSLSGRPAGEDATPTSRAA